jgi:hypothetical protein
MENYLHDEAARDRSREIIEQLRASHDSTLTHDGRLGAISLRTSFALDIGTVLESIPATGISM